MVNPRLGITTVNGHHSNHNNAITSNHTATKNRGEVISARKAKKVVNRDHQESQNLQTSVKKRNCYNCSKPGHYSSQCRSNQVRNVQANGMHPAQCADMFLTQPVEVSELDKVNGMNASRPKQGGGRRLKTSDTRTLTLTLMTVHALCAGADAQGRGSVLLAGEPTVCGSAPLDHPHIYIISHQYLSSHRELADKNTLPQDVEIHVYKKIQ